MKKTIQTYIACFILCFSLNIRAATAKEWLPLAQFCEKSINTEAPRTNIIELTEKLAQQIIGFIDHDHLVKISGKKITYPQKNFPISSASMDSASQLKNIVFLPGSTPENTASTVMTLALKRYLDSKEPIIREMSHAQNVSECIQLAQQNNLDVIKYQMASDRYQNDYHGRKHLLEDPSVNSIASKIDHRDWDVRIYTHASELLEVVKRGRYQNVVIAAHATRDGKLFDSSYLELPKSFFEQLSSEVFSLGIYSCYGDAVADQYKLYRNMGASVSNYSSRFVYIAKTFRDEFDGQIPSHGIPRFLEKVLDENEKSKSAISFKFTKKNQNKCLLRVLGANVERGGFAITLNGRLIGILDRAKVALKNIEYDCAMTASGRNNITIREMSGIEESAFEGDALEVEFDGAATQRKFFRENGRLKGLRLDFEN